VKKIQDYTDQQATDEAVLLLTRKLGRMFPAQYAALMLQMSEGAREALHFADLRADKLRSLDRQDEITRNYVSKYETTDDE